MASLRPTSDLGQTLTRRRREASESWAFGWRRRSCQIVDVIRDSILISTKATFPFGDGPNNMGSSRHHLMRQIEGSLKRLKTDYVDVYHMHGFDAMTPSLAMMPLP